MLRSLTTERAIPCCSFHTLSKEFEGDKNRGNIESAKKLGKAPLQKEQLLRYKDSGL
jgi:hypothetical protein